MVIPITLVVILSNLSLTCFRIGDYIRLLIMRINITIAKEYLAMWLMLIYLIDPSVILNRLTES